MNNICDICANDSTSLKKILKNCVRCNRNRYATGMTSDLFVNIKSKRCGTDIELVEKAIEDINSGESPYVIYRLCDKIKVHNVSTMANMTYCYQEMSVIKAKRAAVEYVMERI